MGLLLNEVFDPAQEASIETNGVVINLGQQLAIAMEADMHDKSKATATTLTKGNGVFRWENILGKERKAG